MCGIAGLYVKDAYIDELPIDDLVDWMYAGIVERGRHATGLVAVTTDNKVAMEKDDKDAFDFIKNRKLLPDNTKMVLQHTRWATLGEPSQMENNHPVMYKTCFATHNGHINNHDDVFRTLGLDDRPAEVDSIAIPAALHYHGFGNFDDARLGLEMLEGGMAIAAVDPDNFPGKLLLAKGMSSPLWILNHPKLIMWASQKKYIEDAWAACIGTPPSRKRTTTEPLGFQEILYGDVLLIEDNAISIDRFKPKSRYIPQHQGGSGSSRSTFHDDGEEYGWEGYQSYGSAMANRKWMCRDAKGNVDFENCIYPCKPGCLNAKCECWIGKQHGLNIQKELDGVSNVPGNGTAHNLQIVRSGSGGGLSDSSAESGSESCVVPRCSNGVAFSDCEGCFYLNCPNKLDGQTGERVVATQDYDADPTEVRIECDACFEIFSDGELEALTIGSQVFFLCETCMRQEVEVKDNDDAKAAAQKLGEAKANHDNRIHQRACLETAYEMNTTVAFVDWILYRCPPRELADDAHLSKVYSEIKHEYENGRKIAEAILMEGKDAD